MIWPPELNIRQCVEIMKHVRAGGFAYPQQYAFLDGMFELYPEWYGAMDRALSDNYRIQEVPNER
jgi:hypothetical protein